MSERRLGFMRTIAEQRDDETARLVYGDYLQELDTPETRARYEFIRLQIELDDAMKSRPDLDALGLDKGVRKSVDYVTQWHQAWCDAELLPAMAAHWRGRGRPRGYLYRRGFLSEIRTTLAEWYDEPAGPGTGTIGRLLLSTQPLEAIIFDDMRPLPRSSVGALEGMFGRHTRHFWYEGRPDNLYQMAGPLVRLQATVPADLYALLPRLEGVEVNPVEGRTGYLSLSEAQLALGQAAVALSYAEAFGRPLARKVN